MKLNDHFKKFVGTISLNTTRVSRIESAVSSWDTKFITDEVIKDIYIDYYTQGSYSTNTGVRPKGEDEFDVDVVLVLDIDEDSDPKDVLHSIKDRIKSYSGFEDKVKAKSRCVRIEYAGEFHVDVVPALEYGSIIKIPSKQDGEWKKTNPAGFTAWCNGINKESDQYFSKVVKILKHWRDENVGKDSAPKSILLTTLVGHAFVKKASIAETLVETLKEIISDIESYIAWLVEDDDVPQISNPSLAEENLARNWSKKKASRFLNKLRTLKDNCVDALEDDDKESSIKKWQDIFGKEYFPSELGAAKAMATSVRAGAVMVGTSGHLNMEEGTKIKDHRFYGEQV
ncbi:SMODS domain-containing nucleotidyltransferase [Fictibacillus barbaricus]|uniref:Nucleotidyltransferase n=1 Tax=Fictibacillus barbaricus TaxID=182136 RepID=A0ABS2ZKX1_9BACL|nr:nucleotidyltransferase [Fictibacillus barbaricus]MBN3547989.1 nucleotidyltransferase [Fictibacillus barbaricus]GGB53131.1 hypothetical protein GCM10007199_18740 [Fictibacillus barbaricus]